MSTPTDFISPELLDTIQATRAAALEEKKHKDITPPDTSVSLPGGVLDPLTGQVDQRAEVRELNGFDEEVLSKERNAALAMLRVLKQAVVSLGDNEHPNQNDIDALLIGDRNALLVAIRAATWGPTVTFEEFHCPWCNFKFDVEIDLMNDIPTRALDSEDRVFDVVLRKGVARVALPTGVAQRAVLSAEGKTDAELNSILLENCVMEINGVPVHDARSVRALGVKDRSTILTEIQKRNPGPLLDEVKEACPECTKEITFPLTVMGLFPLW
jgi:hypothetical protein